MFCLYAGALRAISDWAHVSEPAASDWSRVNKGCRHQQRSLPHVAATKVSHGIQFSLVDFFSVLIRHPPLCGAGAPLFLPCPFTPHFFLFYFSLSFVGFTCFLLLSSPFLSTRIVPLRFQAGGRRKRPNLGLVCWFNLCYPYSLLQVDSGVLFCLV